MLLGPPAQVPETDWRGWMGVLAVNVGRIARRGRRVSMVDDCVVVQVGCSGGWAGRLFERSSGVERWLRGRFRLLCTEKKKSGGGRCFFRMNKSFKGN